MVTARQGQFRACERLLRRAQRQGDETGSLFFAYASEAEYGKALAASGILTEASIWLQDSQAYFTKVENHRAAAANFDAAGRARPYRC